eukprot:1186185-Prorocentrum_minimum.AAC.2
MADAPGVLLERLHHVLVVALELADARERPPPVLRVRRVPQLAVRAHAHNNLLREGGSGGGQEGVRRGSISRV